MFGYRADEAIGRPMAELIVPGHLQAEEDSILARLARGEVIPHFETRRRRKDGELRDVSVTIAPVRDDSGTVIGGAKTVRDITEHKRFEQRLEHLVGQLRLAVHAARLGI